jgi:uncharacterized protein DUF6580
MLNHRSLALVGMILLAAVTRLIPPLTAGWLPLWNFTAVGAACLFGGAYFRRTWQALLVPLVALLISDLILAATVYGFHSLSQIAGNYVLFAVLALLGTTLRGRVSFLRVTSTSLAASLLFFLASNFSVWVLTDMYPHTWDGLLACYVAAIPYAQNTVLGDLFYCGVLFGGFELLSARWPALREPALIHVRQVG